MRSLYACLGIACLSMIVAAGCGDDSPVEPDDSGSRRFTQDGAEFEEYESEWNEYRLPDADKDAPTDDVLDPARVPEFDPALVHSVPVEGWDVNLSHTVFKLDVPILKPDVEGDLLKLNPTYAEAVAAARNWSTYEVIPSVNLIDGKAKQFDDGLYSALDQAYYTGALDALPGHVDFIRRLFEAVGPNSPAAPHLAAGLQLAGVSVEVTDEGRKQLLLNKFELNPLQSKPLGFYGWTPELQQCWRFMKFFQSPFPLTEGPGLDSPRAMADAIAADPALQADYQQAVTFYSRLTNPLLDVSLLELAGNADPAALAARQKAAGLHTGVAVFPSSTSREQRLFEAIFPEGLPPNADLMKALIQAVRSGEVNLAPEPDSGWYDHQAYALEAFLLPDRGEESAKLLFSGRYKQRMLDAFAAMITKRRETHIRQLGVAEAPSAMEQPLSSLSPRFRIEPNATYYLRTARAYAFLEGFLHEAMGEEALAQLHGLRETGPRELNLADELAAQRNLFYGFYLIACEDIGLPSAVSAEELPDPNAARSAALAWLEDWSVDADLAVDTRVIVPVAVDPPRNATNVWGTIGVRLAKLDVAFDSEFRPSVRPAGSSDEWQPADPWTLEGKTYLIPVDEFVSAEIPRLDCPTREDFRRMCNEAGTAEAIRKALAGQP